MNALTSQDHSRGHTWFRALAGRAPWIETGLRTVLAADVRLVNQPARVLAMVAEELDEQESASQEKVGPDDGWVLADQIRDVIACDRSGARRPIVTIVDTWNHVHGSIEKMLGIDFSCAVAADAYAAACAAGHPLIALMVGSVAPGRFLAHGCQAHRLLAIDGPTASGLPSRWQAGMPDWSAGTSINLRHEDWPKAGFGHLYQVIVGIRADAPSSEQIGRVREHIGRAITDVRNHLADVTLRLSGDVLMLGQAADGARQRPSKQSCTVDHWRGDHQKRCTVAR